VFTILIEFDIHIILMINWQCPQKQS